MKYFRFIFFTTVLILSSLVNANYLDRDEVQDFVDYWVLYNVSVHPMPEI